MLGSRRSFFLVLVAALLAAADEAMAWGPAMHVSLGRSVLEQLAIIPAGVAAILARNAIAFLYGNIAADMVFAKRLSRVKQFCHHWSTGMRVLHGAADDRGRAFAYGYLSHLAADTVAHGKFVPRQIVMSDCTVNFGHFYWELRADATRPTNIWSTVEDVLSDDHEHHHEELSAHLTQTLLSYGANRALFERMNALAVRRSFRRTMDAWSRHSRHELPADLIAGYHGECVDRILSVLREGEKSPLLREDPNGTSALMHLRQHRRHTRRLRHSGAVLEQRRRELASSLAPQTAVFSPCPVENGGLTDAHGPTNETGPAARPTAAPHPRLIHVG